MPPKKQSSKQSSKFNLKSTPIPRQKPRSDLKKLPQISPTLQKPHGYNIFDVSMAITHISKELGIDPDELDNTVKTIQKSPICYFPIRHHSIASTYALLQALNELQPEIIFLEAPNGCESFIPFLTDAKARLPLALMNYFKDDQNELGLNGVTTPDPDIAAKFNVWYPYLEYSPEYIAMLYSVHQNIPIVFIDAPYLNTLEANINVHKSLQHKIINSQSQNLPNIANEEIYNESEFFQRFCEFYNSKDLDDAWDLLFEIGAQYRHWKEYQQLLLLYCAAVRSTIPLDILKLDAALFREQYMVAQIQQHLKSKHIKSSKTIVVTGGLHSIALFNTQPLNLANVKTFQSSTNLIPFSFKRLSSLTGYSSGNRSPEFYDKVWKKIRQKRIKSQGCFRDTVLEYSLNIIRKSREKGDLFSSSDSIAVFQSALMLASLRYRPEPNVEDLQDALILCCIKGNPDKENIFFKNRIINEVVGHRLGRVPPSYKQLGLLQDLKQRLGLFDIELTDETQSFHIDLHDSREQELSKLFWQIDIIDLGVVKLQEGAGRIDIDVDIYHEIWLLQWSPTLSLKLIDKSSLGSTVEETAITILKDSILQQQSNSELCAKILIHCLKMGLIKQFADFKDYLDQALSQDHNFFQLAQGFQLLFLIRKILEVEQKRLLPDINRLVKKAFLSICSQIPNLANPPKDKVDQFISLLKAISNSVITEYKLTLDRLVLDGALHSAYLYSTNGYIAGSLLGARYILQQIDIIDVKMEILAMTKSSLEIQLKIGEFIRGLVELCHAKIIFEPEFFKILITVIELLNWDLFLTILPGLKNAFSKLPPRDFDEILGKIAEHYQVKTVKMDKIVEATEEIKSIITIWDAQTYEILQNWITTKSEQ